jgi:hypothetical protein
MYHGLFACTMYDFHVLELCTMYESHGIYLRVLWTICMYKFSKCHAVVFMVFSFHLPIFGKNRPEIMTLMKVHLGPRVGFGGLMINN